LPIASATRSSSTQGKELDELKNKYEETKNKMEKMKREKNENNKRLIEMSGLVKRLQDIPVGYDKSEGSTFVNVQRKIQAIDHEMKQAKNRYDELRSEKTFQSDTIKAQESQMKTMEDQIQVLNERLKQEELDQQEQKKQTEQKQKENTDELEQRIMLQDMEIMNLMGEIDNLKTNGKFLAHNDIKEQTNTIGQDIKLLEVDNAAKYAEIKKMEDKLAMMRSDQRTQKMEQESFLKKQSEESSGFILQPTATTFAEISKLEDNMANLRLEQEKSNIFKSKQKAIEENTGKKPATSKRQSSQPWNRDLAWLEETKIQETELEVVANNDIVYDEPVPPKSDHDDQKSLDLPNFGTKNNSVVKSARKKKGVSPFGVSVCSSSNSQSRCSSSEESESESEASEHYDKQQQYKNPFNATMDKYNSDTTATAESSTSSLSETDDSETTCVSEASNHKRAVELMHSDDGSIEVIEVEALLPGVTVEKTESTDEVSTDNESSVEYSSGESANEDSTNEDCSNYSSSGEYTSGESTQTESRSILEQIPEEGELESESESDWEGDQESIISTGIQLTKTKDEQVDDLLLAKQLKDAQDKYEKLMEDHKGMVSMSESKAKKLEEENQKLRSELSGALNSSAKESDEKTHTIDPKEVYKPKGSTKNARSKRPQEETKAKDPDEKARSKRLKDENKMLLRNMEKQNNIMMKAEKNYEKLQFEHLATIEELEENKKRYDKLILDFTNLADRNKDSGNYSRMEALHDAVVMKLADLGDENEKLEKQRDAAVDQLENKNIQIRAFDEAIAEMNKVESDLKTLQEVHVDTVSELHDLTDKNKELKYLHEKEAANAAHLDTLEQGYTNAKAEIEILMKANKELSGTDTKLSESEVRVTMLEGELKKSKEDLGALKKKSNKRQGQLKDVIAQYKSLKQEHTDKCAKLTHLEIALNGLDDDSAIMEMKKMEEAVNQAKKDADKAVKAKEARERDMRIVLQHYEKLQMKFEKLKAKYDSATTDHDGVTENQGRVPLPKNLTYEENKDEQDTYPTGDDGDARLQEVEQLEKLLKESKESLTWRDEKIVKALAELKAAKEQVEDVETEKEQLQVDLSKLKSQLLLARREANKAEERQGSGHDHLRTAIVNNHRLQQTYSSLQRKFEEVNADLKQSKEQVKVHEQGEKQARKRASIVHTQYKKLQTDHDVVVERLEKLKIQMTISHDY